MIRLLLYSHYFAPHIGGVETVLRELAEGLAASEKSPGEKRFAVTVATRTPADPASDDGGLPYQVLRCPSLAQLWRAVRMADVVHVAGAALSPLLLGFGGRRPVVVEHHGFQVVCPNGQFFHEGTQRFCVGHFMAGHHAECLRCCAPQVGRLGALKLWLLTFVRRFLCRFAAGNVLPTAWLGSKLLLPRTITLLHGVRAQQADAVTPPVDPPRFTFVGRLVASKGVAILLAAANLLKTQGRSFEVCLIGDGPERSALQARAAELGLSAFVHFRNRVSDAEAAATVARSTALIAPSLAGEVFGMVLAEAMSSGVPVIASDLGSFAEVVQDGGLIFRAGDAPDLAAQITRLINDPSLRDRLALSAHHRAITTFTIEAMVEGHARIYEQVCRASA